MWLFFRSCHMSPATISLISLQYSICTIKFVTERALIFWAHSPVKCVGMKLVAVSLVRQQSMLLSLCSPSCAFLLLFVEQFMMEYCHFCQTSNLGCHYSVLERFWRKVNSAYDSHRVHNNNKTQLL